MSEKHSWLLKHLPTVLILVVIWMVTRLSGVDYSIANFLGIVLTILCIGALIFEFFKSGEITQKAFAFDLAFALLAVVLDIIVLTLLIRDKGVFGLVITDYLLGGIVLVDAWLSTFNSFRGLSNKLAVTLLGQQR